MFHWHIKIEMFWGLALVTPKEHKINVDFSACKVNHILMEYHQKRVNILSENFIHFI